MEPEKGFEEYFGRKPDFLFSAPGRTELSGNHTDHQHGRVLAAAINLETLAAVSPNGTTMIRVYSEGFGLSRIDVRYTEKKDEEIGTTASILRGTAAVFTEIGAEPFGFDAFVCSSVLAGSGLSSSAAFEVLIGAVMNDLWYLGKCDTVELARIGQRVENSYFGKPCGLMDQTACAVGGILSIDFFSPETPRIEKLSFDFASSGYALCIIDSGADHADLTPEYSAITDELRNVCAFFGKRVLREIPEDVFYDRLPALRRSTGDRAVLRAIHVFEENKRVLLQADALRNGRFLDFLRMVEESGASSWQLLQNVIPSGRVGRQEVAFALSAARHYLPWSGACRVHGGGFAGTIQAFVPLENAMQFQSDMDRVLFPGACKVLSIRSVGCGRVR